MEVRDVYDLLLKEYGPQGWWPVISDERFEIVVGAVLTQNTSWTNVEKAIRNLVERDLIAPEKILEVSLEELSSLIRPAGYYNQKAVYLKEIARFYSEGEEVSRENLLSVKGVGKETADSILLYYHDRPYFVVDAYTKRIFSCLFPSLKGKGYDEFQRFFHENLDADVELFKEFHALIVEHAKRVCMKKPKCDSCVLRV